MTTKQKKCPRPSLVAEPPTSGFSKGRTRKWSFRQDRRVHLGDAEIVDLVLFFLAGQVTLPRTILTPIFQYTVSIPRFSDRVTRSVAVLAGLGMHRSFLMGFALPCLGLCERLHRINLLLVCRRESDLHAVDGRGRIVREDGFVRCACSAFSDRIATIDWTLCRLTPGWHRIQALYSRMNTCPSTVQNITNDFSLAVKDPSAAQTLKHITGNHHIQAKKDADVRRPRLQLRRCPSVPCTARHIMQVCPGPGPVDLLYG